MPYAMGADAIAIPDSDGWKVDAASTVLMRNIFGEWGLLLDNRPWHAYNRSELIVPAGHHSVRRSGQPDGSHAMRLMSITGELLDVRGRETECRVDYFSRIRCVLSFSRRPSIISLDGVLATMPVLMNGEISTIIAPPGKHSIVVSGD